MTLKVGALFAGYGGIELALASVLDTEPAWFSEFDKAPSAILAHHWPDVPNLGDVTKVDWAAVEPVDIITGGSPCQDLSHAGKRAGMKAGTRSGLWASMCDAIDIIRPSLVVWENVRGALSAEADSAVEPCPICVGDGAGRVSLRALGRVLGDLAELGYDASWYGLRAADVGAAHGRWRVFVFAQPADAVGSGLEGLADQAGAAPTGRHGHAVEGVGGPAIEHVPGQLPLLPTPSVADGLGGHLTRSGTRSNELLLPGVAKSLATPLLPTPRATDGTKGGPNQRGSSGDLMLPSAVQKMVPTPTVGDSKSARNSTATRHVTPPTGVHAGDTLTDAFVPVAGGKLLPTPRVSSERTSRGALTREGHWSAPGLAQAVEFAEGILPREYESWDELQGNQAQDWREYEAAIRRQEAAFGRPAPLPTEPGSKGQPRLSPAFVEWLMGLPEGHVTNPAIGISRNDQLKALGNGVVPQQCAAALRAFLADTQERAA